MLAPRDAVLARSNDMVMGRSSLEPTSSLAVSNEQDTPETPQTTEEQYQQWSEPNGLPTLTPWARARARVRAIIEARLVLMNALFAVAKGITHRIAIRSVAQMQDGVPRLPRNRPCRDATPNGPPRDQGQR